MKQLLFLAMIFLSFTASAIEDPMAAPDLKNKVVYLDFWASWCGPCKDSFPWLNEINSKYKDKGFVVIGINLDKEKSKAEAFLKNNPATFKLIFNSEGDLAKKYGVKGMPYSIIIDKTGKIIHTHIGFHPDKTKEYVTIIEGALK